MLNRVLRHIQAKEIRGWIVFHLGKGELGIGEADTELPRSVEALHSVRSLEDEVHAFAMVEVVEECHKLNDPVLSDNLKSS